MEGDGGIGLVALQNAVAPVGGVVGVEDEAIGSGGGVDGVVGEGFGGVEVKAEEEAMVFVGDEFVAFIDEALLDGFAIDDAVVADEVDYGLVEVGEGMEF